MDKQILCVDDEKPLRDLIVRSVSSWGYNIQCAANVAEAQEMFEALRPFLTITDLRLDNHIDGVTLADRLHREEPMAIFVALSGWVSSFDLGYLLGSVFADVLPKPIDCDDLKSVIDHAWEKRQRWERLLDG